MNFKSNEYERISDPGTRPDDISDSLRLQIVKTGLVKPSIDFEYPK